MDEYEERLREAREKALVEKEEREEEVAEKERLRTDFDKRFNYLVEKL